MYRKSKVVKVFGDTHSKYDDNDDLVRYVYVLFDNYSYEGFKLYITDRNHEADINHMIYEMDKHLKGKTKKEIFDYFNNFLDSYMDEYKKYYQKLSEEIMKT